MGLAESIIKLIPNRNRGKSATAPMPKLAQSSDFPQGSPLTLPVAPTPKPPGSDTAQWLALALSALGGGPDRNAYTAPFDAAAQRAQSANAQALPQIAAGYDRLRSELGTAQAGADQSAAQAQQNMASQQGQTQANIAALVAPVLAQIQSAGGNAALGSLTGAAQAQVQTGQGQLAQQGAAQQQLSQNLQAAGTQSYQSRVQDSQLAQQSATTSANSNLAQVLNALDARKAQALQQYAGDSASHASQVAQVKMNAMDRDTEKNDPGRAIELERARLALENDKLDLADRQGQGQGGSNQYAAQLANWHDTISTSNPTSYQFLTELIGDGGSSLGALIGKINSSADKNGKVKYQGKKLDARWLRDRLTELDELERLDAEAEDKKSSRR